MGKYSRKFHSIFRNTGYSGKAMTLNPKDSRTIEQQEKQAQLDHHITLLPSAIETGRGGVIQWLGDLAEFNNYPGMLCNARAIAKELRAAGYKDIRNIPPERRSRYHRKWLNIDPDLYAEYLIGHAMGDLDSNPHRPLSRGYASSMERYLALFPDEAVNIETVRSDRAAIPEAGRQRRLVLEPKREEGMSR
jgi:hypothetical protein